MEEQDRIESIVERYNRGNSSPIVVMQDISQEYGYLPEEVLAEVAERIGVPISIFYSLATFYKSFRLEPLGKQHVCVCVGTACHVRGAAKLVDTLERELHVQAGRTSADGQYTLDTVNCLGACALGPLVTINGEYHGKVDQKKLGKLLKTVQREDEAQTP